MVVCCVKLSIGFVIVIGWRVLCVRVFVFVLCMCVGLCMSVYVSVCDGLRPIE